MSKLIPVLIVAALGACTGRGYYTASATVSTPNVDLAYVSPGVYVLADYDEPIFYSGGAYWYYSNGYWYRSRSYTGGWSYATPPRALVSISSPYAYVHYRPRNYTPRYRPVPSYRIERPVVRDHRTVRARRYYYPRR